MKRKMLVVLTLAAGLVVMAGPMFAHHSGAGIYDRDHPVTVSGTVTEYVFINPHVQIHFDAKAEDGAVQSWTAESAAPQRLYRAGWTKDTLKPGDQVTVTGAPSKDNKRVLSIRKLVGPGGKVLSEGAE